MQRIEFSAPLADAKNYPAAVLKVNPNQPLAHSTLFANPVLKNQKLQFFATGRGALFYAALRLKREGDNEVLLPAYHCPALVEPFIAAGYQIRFYPVQPDLKVDLSSLKSLISTKTSHCLLVRYFGNAEGVADNLRWLSAQGIVTFDDCAHDLQSFITPTVVADAAICSIRKFIASHDGGALRLKVAPAAAEKTPVAVSWMVEGINLLKFLLSIFSAAITTRPKPHLCSPMATVQQVASEATTTRAEIPAANVVVKPEGNEPFRYLQHKDQEQSCYRLTQWQLTHINLSQVIQARQQHAAQLMKGLAGSPLGSLLWPQLPPACAPYVIPFLLNDKTGFDLLRKRGLQVLRWEELAVSDCTVSQDYRARLIQIPCHQDLNEDDIHYIIQCFNM
ncbi:DegT/DnrJ/EryC1/StrS family aminotransferase [Rheinheimera sp.]|uniref:DegT/DnrJ/EryC1/StrS family aminotransferase n=1 Tax=Rheinheimera sp. TaxID=1869214 RepID=UPI0027B99BEA|nr:DegT/DnrJ/EryC1/StrS family aminotransferase [Rheinheimera sp.]